MIISYLKMLLANSRTQVEGPLNQLCFIVTTHSPVLNSVIGILGSLLFTGEIAMFASSFFKLLMLTDFEFKGAMAIRLPRQMLK